MRMAHRTLSTRPARRFPARRFPAWKRVPAFIPVPRRTRQDGWTVARQVRFIGWLAQTGSVAEAARRAGCSRETAYRLRRSAGAASFAHAWDSALALRRGFGAGRRKVTPAELTECAFAGPVRVQMRGGQFLRASRKPCNSALLRLLASYDRALRGQDGADRWGG